jgi:hypothetical protein
VVRRPLYDALGPGFTLLCFDRSACISGLVDAAAWRGLPLAVLDIEAPEAQALYARNLVLVRPDQHVAWRADAEPVTCIDLIDRSCGALATKAHKAAYYLQPDRRFWERPEVKLLRATRQNWLPGSARVGLLLLGADMLATQPSTVVAPREGSA